MDTELLRTFLVVEKNRHFGRAADSLYLTNAAVSARIRQLEGLVGTPLFIRYRNNLTLTPAGEQLKPFAESILASWNRALHESSLASGQIKLFSIGGTPNLWDSILQDYLHQVHLAYPDISLKAECHGTELLTQQLVARSLDIVVMFDPPKLDGYVLEKVQEIELMLVSSGSELAADGVTVPDYVQVDWGVSFDARRSELYPHLSAPVLYTSTGRIALDFILQHGGAAYLPGSFVQPYLARGLFHRIQAAPSIIRHVHAAYLRDSAKVSLLQDVVRLLKSSSFLAAPTLQP
jgi:DNA-binding transcriptional LysR family regulator